MMRHRTIGFVVMVNLAALVAGLELIRIPSPAEHFWMLVTLCGLAAVFGSTAVRLSALRFEITPTHPFILVALALYGGWAAALVALASVAGSALRPGRRTKLLPLAFNFGSMFLSAAAAAAAFRAAGGTAGVSVSSLALPLLAATLIYGLVNTGLVATIVSIKSLRSPLRVWIASFAWTPLSYLTGLVVALALLALLGPMTPWVLALALPPCGIMLSYYRYRAALTCAPAEGG